MIYKHNSRSHVMTYTSSSNKTQRYVSIGMAFLMMFTNVPFLLRSTYAAGETADPDFSKKLSAIGELKHLSERLEGLEKANVSPLTSTYDVDAKAKELGNDVPNIFAFVRDEVRYEVYEGVLRGPRGTLMGLAGNSFDKALLLAALLRHYELPVRFKRAHLNPKHARDLVNGMFASANSAKSIQSKRAGSSISEDAASISNAVTNRLVSRTADNVEVVKTALKGRGIEFADEAAGSVDTLTAEAADHVWIEYQQGDKWVALDPSLPQTKPGDAVGEPANEMAELPQTVFHHVAIRMTLEERVGNRVNTRDVLHYESTAADLNGKRVSLTNEVTWSKSNWSAVPSLRVETTPVKGEKFNGTITTDLAGGMKAGIETMGNRMFKKPGETKADPAPEITAVWLNFDWMAPSGARRTISREVFDRIGLAARSEHQEGAAQLAPAPTIIGIPAPLLTVFGFSFSGGNITPELVASHLVQHAPRFREIDSLQAARQQPSVEQKKQLASAGRTAFPDLLSSMAMSFHMHSQLSRVLALSTASGDDACLYPVSPRLCIVSAGFGMRDNRISMKGNLTVDLRQNDLRSVARNAGGIASQWANVVRGIADGVLESILFGDVPSVNEGGFESLSAVSVFQAARSSKVETSVFQNEKEVRVAHLSKEAKERMLTMLGENIALVAPMKAIPITGSQRVGWWQINLQSGETMSVMDDGLHTTGSEYTVKTHEQVFDEYFAAEGASGAGGPGGGTPGTDFLTSFPMMTYTLSVLLTGIMIGWLIGLGSGPQMSQQDRDRMSGPAHM